MTQPSQKDGEADLVPTDSRKSGKSETSIAASTAPSIFAAVQKNKSPKSGGDSSNCCGLFGSKKASQVFRPALLLIRHSERLDYVDKEYKTSEEGKLWPHDAPLTEAGWALARTEAEELAKLHQELNFAVVATSPYRRCVETASVFAKRLGLPMVLDQEVGEVWEKNMGEDPLPWRKPAQLQEMLKELKVEEVLNPILEDGGIKLFGKLPKFPESLDRARNRMVVRFEAYIRQSEALKQNFIVCTHADGIAAAVNMFERGLPDITQMDFCCRVLARQNKKGNDGKDSDDNTFAKQWVAEIKGIHASKAEMTEGAQKYWEKMHLENCEEHQERVHERKKSRTQTDKMFDESLAKKLSMVEIADDAEQQENQA